jgi:Ca-activated chloride channel homolog
MRQTAIKYLLCGILVLTAFPLWAQKKAPQALPEKTRILFLLDASGSMMAPMGNTTRMQVAKDILSHLVDSLRVNPNLELGLRVYGHRSPAKDRNCKDTRLEIPFSKGNHDALIQRIKVIRPQGNTPIAYSLEQSAGDFPNEPGYRNVLILITDGLESCDGDPCAVSLALQQRNVFLKPFVVGLGMEQEVTNQFDCVGDYYDAKNPRAFFNTINTILYRALAPTTASIELLDAAGNKTEKDVNVTFVNNFTNQPVFDFVHYRYPNGAPDSVEVDAILNYDLVVNTVPTIVKKNVVFVGGKHNIIEIKAPQGWLNLTQANSFEYDDKIRVLVKQSGKNEIICIQDLQVPEKYLMGTYDLEITTFPRTKMKQVKVNEKQTTNLQIPAPGRLNLSYNLPGVGSLYRIYPDGSQEWFHNLDVKKNTFSFAMQPGKYKVVFRSHMAKGSKYTDIKEFEIKSGQTTSIKIFGS